MRTCRRLIARRSNQVMYAMPVSKAMMMTSERTTSITTSNTREQHLLAQGLRKVRMFSADERTHDVDALRRRTDAELLGDASHDGPVGSSMWRRHGATLLVLQPTFEVDQRCLALVGVGHGQDVVDPRVVGHGLSGGQYNARERAGMQVGPGLVADRRLVGRGE